MTMNLEAKVKATNGANKYAAEFYDKLARHFSHYVGQTVLKADGKTLMKRVADSLPELPNTRDLMVTADLNESALSFKVRVRIQTDDWHSEYSEQSIYVGAIRDGALVNIAPPRAQNGWNRTDWTVEEIERLRRERTEARQKVQDINDKLGPFQS